MSLSIEARSELAARQAALVWALVAGGKLPTGFQEERVRAATLALARKRARAAARAWPALTQTLDARYPALFAGYAAATPLPQKGGALADGRAFAQWLDAQGELPDHADLEVMAVDLRYTQCAEGLAPRKGSAVRATLLNQPRWCVVAVRLPWVSEWWFKIPLALRFSNNPGRSEK